VQSKEKQQPERRCFQSREKDVDTNKLKVFLKAKEGISMKQRTLKTRKG
jgi:hypothetical protein